MTDPEPLSVDWQLEELEATRKTIKDPHRYYFKIEERGTEETVKMHHDRNMALDAINIWEVKLQAR